jgi:hypothetical protein
MAKQQQRAKALKKAAAAANMKPPAAPALTAELAECLISPTDGNVAEGLFALAQAIQGLAGELGKLRTAYVQRVPLADAETSVYEEPDEDDEDVELEA